MIRTLDGARAAVACAVTLLAITGAPVGAQNDRTAEVHHRNQCRLAAQVVETGEPSPRREWARTYITTCAEEGPRILARAWRTTPADTARLGDLVNASGRLRDERLYDAMQAVASDRSRPDVVRVAAMLALSRYVDPHSAVWFSDLRIPEDSVRRIPLVTGWQTHGGHLEGTRPLNRSVANPVLQLLDEIAQQQAVEPRTVWYAAAVLAKRVRTDFQTGRAVQER